MANEAVRRPAARSRLFVALGALVASALATAIYGAEVVLELSQRNARDDLWAAREARGEAVDRRDLLEVLGALRRDGRDAVSSTVPARLLHEREGGALHSAIALDGREVVAFSGPSGITTVLCNELGHWATFESDRFGFRNTPAHWATPPALALVGDSFTIGRCVATEHTLAARLHAVLPTLNLGMGGTGPLAQLGILTEYGPIARPRRTIWIFYDNDLGAADLGFERRSPLLMRYLEPGFSQGLAERQRELDRALRGLLAEREAAHRSAPGEPRTRFAVLRRSLGLPLLRERVEHLRALGAPAPAPAAETLALFERILVRGREVAASWGGDLHVAFLPRDGHLAPHAPPDVTAQAVLAAAARARLPALDLSDALRPEGSALYAYPSGTAAGPSHLNERGYAVAADALLRFVARGGESPHGAP